MNSRKINHRYTLFLFYVINSGSNDQYFDKAVPENECTCYYYNDGYDGSNIAAFGQGIDSNNDCND